MAACDVCGEYTPTTNHPGWHVCDSCLRGELRNEAAASRAESEKLREELAELRAMMAKAKSAKGGRKARK